MESSRRPVLTPEKLQAPDKSISPKKRFIQLAQSDQLSKKQKLNTNTHANLFQPEPLNVEKNPFRRALEQHFDCMSSKKDMDFSMVLKDIACFHRNSRQNLTAEQKGFLSVILFFYQKSLVLAPDNETAKNELDSYKQHQPLSFTATENLARELRYTIECKTMGPENFFWHSIDNYISRVQTVFPQEANKVLIGLCEYLDKSPSIERMRKTAMPYMDRRGAEKVFGKAAQELNTPTLNFSRK